MSDFCFSFWLCHSTASSCMHLSIVCGRFHTVYLHIPGQASSQTQTHCKPETDDVISVWSVLEGARWHQIPRVNQRCPARCRITSGFSLWSFQSCVTALEKNTPPAASMFFLCSWLSEKDCPSVVSFTLSVGGARNRKRCCNAYSLKNLTSTYRTVWVFANLENCAFCAGTGGERNAMRFGNAHLRLLRALFSCVSLRAEWRWGMIWGLSGIRG